MVSKALLKSGKTFKNLLTEILRFITKEYKNLLSSARSSHFYMWITVKV